LENNQVEVVRRDTFQKMNLSFDTLDLEVEKLLDEIQQNLFERSLQFRKENIRKADSWDEFIDILDNKGGFVLAHWDGTAETEQLIKENSKATIRCIPIDNQHEDGKCILTGKPSIQRVLFARAY
jgi:prolyl-tRNA synthetase